LNSIGDELYVWSTGGYSFIHSLDEVIRFVAISLRDLDMASQMAKIKIKMDSMDIIDPIEETMFHVAYASG